MCAELALKKLEEKASWFIKTLEPTDDESSSLAALPVPPLVPAAVPALDI